MKKTLGKFMALLVVFAMCLSQSVVFADVNADNEILTAKEVMTKESYVASDATVLPYRLYVPTDYNPEKQYSFLLFLHGAGNRGTDNEDQVRKNTGLLDRIINGEEIASGGEKLDSSKEFIIVAPQCAPEKQWVDTPWGATPDPSYNIDEIPQSQYMTAVVELIDKCKAEYNLNPARMYITGLSMGGFGTWDLITRNPDLFAAAIPMGGAGDPNKADIIANTPVWTFHQLQDPTVVAEGTLRMVKALTEAKAEVRFTPYFDGVHNAWTKGYAEPDMLNWLYSHTKDGTGNDAEKPLITNGASDWAKGEIALSAAAGIMPLKLSEDYLADITREEFCEMVVNILPEDIESAREAVFEDTDNEAVIYAYSVGVVNGTGEKTFEPNLSATREEMATMLYRAYKLIAPDAAKTSDGSSPDRSDMSDWAIEAVDFMNEQTIMNGDELGFLKPLAHTSREEAILLVYRTFLSANRYGK